ncbi:MAG: hypothetical protein ABIR70_21615 [Bryobacteraceae bacterium]
MLVSSHIQVTRKFGSSAFAILTVVCGVSLGQQVGQQIPKPLILGRFLLPQNVLLSTGAQLKPGVYDVRLLAGPTVPATGSIPGMEGKVEFVRKGFFFWHGKAVGNELVNIVPAEEVGKIKEQDRGVPERGAHQILVTPHEFFRIWMNKDDIHYLVYLRLPD